jgi:hypothetical protein
MLLLRTTVGFTVIVASVTIILAQNQAIAGFGDRLDKNKPSVFLSYDGEEVVDEDCSLKKEPSYRLRLTNNTARPINVDANYNSDSRTIALTLPNMMKATGLPDRTRVSLCYQAEPILIVASSSNNGELWKDIPKEQQTPELPVYCRCVWSQQRSRRDDDYAGAWIPSGSSVIFTVPKRYLVKGLKIYTIFNYDWEFDGGKLRADEPHHQVFFYSTDLPVKTAP